MAPHSQQVCWPCSLTALLGLQALGLPCSFPLTSGDFLKAQIESGRSLVRAAPRSFCRLLESFSWICLFPLFPKPARWQLRAMAEAGFLVIAFKLRLVGGSLCDSGACNFRILLMCGKSCRRNRIGPRISPPFLGSCVTATCTAEMLRPPLEDNCEDGMKRGL